jgi:hypothetical protein
VAWEANYLGHGGVAFMNLVTGLHPETIRRGQAELAAGLAERPCNRVRLPGPVGRRSEKKSRSKWNPVEHRLFGPISINWAGEPLGSLAKMLGPIRGTRTQAGLRVTASCTHNHYPAHVSVSRQEYAHLKIRHHHTCPNWTTRLVPVLPKSRSNFWTTA